MGLAASAWIAQLWTHGEEPALQGTRLTPNQGAVEGDFAADGGGRRALPPGSTGETLPGAFPDPATWRHVFPPASLQLGQRKPRLATTVVSDGKDTGSPRGWIGAPSPGVLTWGLPSFLILGGPAWHLLLGFVGEDLSHWLWSGKLGLLGLGLSTEMGQLFSSRKSRHSSRALWSAKPSSQ